MTVAETLIDTQNYDYKKNPFFLRRNVKLKQCCCISVDTGSTIVLVLSIISIIGGALAFTGTISFISGAIGFWMIVGGSSIFAISLAALIAFTVGSIKSCSGRT
ncbi:MAG: hypothetical protein KDK55_04030 [Chlamydiia bacterium]|nr:hypothetical protein [Chlamydiia bacterium]